MGRRNQHEDETKDETTEAAATAAAAAADVVAADAADTNDTKVSFSQPGEDTSPYTVQTNKWFIDGAGPHSKGDVVHLTADQRRRAKKNVA